ncbi:MAG: TerB family tellurite resistance protein [Myxococcales bacterium]|nr:TerB family tellurite resistance protein [Myxococcales bacterium]
MIRDFFSEQALSFEDVKVLTHALLAVARVDGVHDNEMALVREFYDGCARVGDPRLEEVAAGQFDPEQAKTCFDTPEKAQLFVKSLILLGFADGVYGKAEDELIRSYAITLGLSSEEVDGLHQSTKDFLMGSLSHVKNVDALRAVFARLDPQ